MPHDVDDGTETADPFVVPVYFPPLVVVEFGAHLNGRGGSYVTYHFRAEQDDIINVIFITEMTLYAYTQSREKSKSWGTGVYNFKKYPP